MRKILAGLICLISVKAFADLECSGLYWPGQSDIQDVSTETPLKNSLLTVNPYNLRNLNMKDEILEDYGSDSQKYGIFNTREICLSVDDQYYVLSQNDFGTAYMLNHSVSSCSKCVAVNKKDLPYYQAGISLGQSKAEVSSSLGFEIVKDTAKIEHNYLQTVGDVTTYHYEYVLVNFVDEKLVFLLAANVSEPY